MKTPKTKAQALATVCRDVEDWARLAGRLHVWLRGPVFDLACRLARLKTGQTMAWDGRHLKYVYRAARRAACRVSVRKANGAGYEVRKTADFCLYD